MRALLLALMASCATPLLLYAQSIGIYADPNGASCAITATAFTPFSYYALVRLDGLSGITGAEFRVGGVDPAWFTTVTSAPFCDLVCPNFIGDGGSLGFPSCQVPATRFVLLASIQSLAVSQPVATRELRVAAARFPSNPNFDCPGVALCDAPIFTRQCVAAGAAIVNGPCSVAVQPTSWSRVKALFD